MGKSKYRIKSNREFWQKEIGRTIIRDIQVNNHVTKQDWTGIHFRSKEVRKNLNTFLTEIKSPFAPIQSI